LSYSAQPSVPEDQARSVEPWATENDDLAQPPVQVVQQKRARAKRLGVFAEKRRIGTEEDSGMVRVNRPAYLHDNHRRFRKPTGQQLSALAHAWRPTTNYADPSNGLRSIRSSREIGFVDVFRAGRTKTWGALPVHMY